MRVRSTVILALTASLIAGTAQAACRDYPNQAAAQRAFDANPQALRALDRDNDQLACETFRYPEPRTGSSMGRAKAYWSTPNAYVLPPTPRYFTQWPRD